MNEWLPFIALAGLIVALAGLIIGLFAWLRQDMREQSKNFQAQLDALDKNFQTQLDALSKDLRARLDEQSKNFQAQLDAQGKNFQAQLDAQGKDLKDVRSQLAALTKETASLAERVSRLEGLIEGLFRPHPGWPSDPAPNRSDTALHTDADG